MLGNGGLVGAVAQVQAVLIVQHELAVAVDAARHGGRGLQVDAGVQRGAGHRRIGCGQGRRRQRVARADDGAAARAVAVGGAGLVEPDGTLGLDDQRADQALRALLDDVAHGAQRNGAELDGRATLGRAVEQVPLDLAGVPGVGLDLTRRGELRRVDADVAAVADARVKVHQRCVQADLARRLQVVDVERDDVGHRRVARQIRHRLVGGQAVGQVDGDAVARIGAQHQWLRRLGAGTQRGDVAHRHVHQRGRVGQAGAPVVDQGTAGQQVTRGPGLDVVRAGRGTNRATVEAQGGGHAAQHAADQSAQQAVGAAQQAGGGVDEVGGQGLEQAAGDGAGELIDHVRAGVGTQDAPGAVPQRVGRAVVEEVVHLLGTASNLGEQADVHLEVLGDAKLLRADVRRRRIGHLTLPLLAVQREDLLHFLGAVDQAHLHALALVGAQHRGERVAVHGGAEDVGRVATGVRVQVGHLAITRQAQRQGLVLVVDEEGVVVLGRDHLGLGRRVHRHAVGLVEQAEVGAGEHELAEVRVGGLVLRVLDLRDRADTATQRLATLVQPGRALGLDHQRVVEAVLLDRRRAEVVVREHGAQRVVDAVLVIELIGPPALDAGLEADLGGCRQGGVAIDHGHGAVGAHLAHRAARGQRGLGTFDQRAAREGAVFIVPAVAAAVRRHDVELDQVDVLADGVGGCLDLEVVLLQHFRHAVGVAELDAIARVGAEEERVGRARQAFVGCHVAVEHVDARLRVMPAGLVDDQVQLDHRHVVAAHRRGGRTRVGKRRAGRRGLAVDLEGGGRTGSRLGGVAPGLAVEGHRGALQRRAGFGQQQHVGGHQLGRQVGRGHAGTQHAGAARDDVTADAGGAQRALGGQVQRRLRRAVACGPSDKEGEARRGRRAVGGHGRQRHPADRQDAGAEGAAIGSTGQRVGAAAEFAVGQHAGAVLEHVMRAPQAPHALGEVRVHVAMEDRVAHRQVAVAAGVGDVKRHALARADGLAVEVAGLVSVLGLGKPLVGVQVEDVGFLDAGLQHAEAHRVAQIAVVHIARIVRVQLLRAAVEVAAHHHRRVTVGPGSQEEVLQRALRAIGRRADAGAVGRDDGAHAAGAVVDGKAVADADAGTGVVEHVAVGLHRLELVVQHDAELAEPVVIGDGIAVVDDGEVLHHGIEVAMHHGIAATAQVLVDVEQRHARGVDRLVIDQLARQRLGLGRGHDRGTDLAAVGVGIDRLDVDRAEQAQRGGATVALATGGCAVVVEDVAAFALHHQAVGDVLARLDA